jgi:predicted transcriptional regulator
VTREVEFCNLEAIIALDTGQQPPGDPIPDLGDEFVPELSPADLKGFPRRFIARWKHGRMSTKAGSVDCDRRARVWIRVARAVGKKITFHGATCMMIDLKPEQQRVIDLAVKSGAYENPGEVLDQAFAIIREQLDLEDWMLGQREEVAAHIAAGFAEAERGDLIDGDAVVEVLRNRRAERLKPLG